MTDIQMNLVYGLRKAIRVAKIFKNKMDSRMMGSKPVRTSYNYPYRPNELNSTKAESIDSALFYK
jgi:hypothetical protein